MTCPGAVHKTHRTVCLLIRKEETMQGAFIAILTFSLGTGAAPRCVCTYYDVVEHLNISSHSKLHTHILPKANLEEPMEVMMDFLLVAILSVVEKLQTVSFYFVLDLSWKNPFATWDPQDFCNISKVVVPVDMYWSPPIFILERVNGQNSHLDYVTIMHNGTFIFSQTFQVTLTCSLMILKFPFDTQMCNVSIASYLHPVTDLVMKARRTAEEIIQYSQSFFLTDGEWKFTNMSILEHAEMLNDGEFSVVTYMISMHRRPILYVLNLILPTCALYLLDMAVLFGPSSLEEKISFQITIILGSSMLAVILNNMLPTSSNKPPIIVVFFLGTFLLMIMAVLDTFFLLHQQHKSLRFNKTLGSFEQEVLVTRTINKLPMERPTKEGAQRLNLPKKDKGKGRPGNPQRHPLEQDPFLTVLEKVLLYTHFYLSLVFFAIICIKWSS